VGHVDNRIPLMRLTARNGAGVVGLALVAESGPRLRRPTLYVQGTRGRMGRIPSERGGFLVHKESAPEVWRAYLDFLGRAVAGGRWNRGVVGWIPPAVVPEKAPDGATHVVRWREPNYLVELQHVREVGDYMKLLGNSTRKNMRRSRRAYERRGGPLRLRIATDVAEAQQFFNRLMALHQALWTSRGWPGNFADPAVVAFHRDLIDRRTASGEIQIARITAGDDEVGYLYSLVYRGHVIGYDMGLCYESDNIFQPGRMCDWMAIEHYAGQGLDLYDNLSGETQFKRSLATKRGEMVWLLVRRDRPFDLLEERVRHAVIAAARDTALGRWHRRLRVAVDARLDRLR
jgi:CelD/BcsL family acetyltransferase involved in cellulose biosynthesis